MVINPIFYGHAESKSSNIIAEMIVNNIKMIIITQL